MNDVVDIFRSRLARLATGRGVSQRFTSGGIVSMAITGFKYVEPIDGPATLFRWCCAVFGIIGFVWLLLDLIFAAVSAEKPSGHRRK